MSKLNLLAVGDICLQTKNNKNPFEKVKTVFDGGDILFGNLETVVSQKGKEVDRAVPLHVLPGSVIHLKNAGFDIVNIANNHVMDMGSDAFNETLEVLDQNGICFVGGGNEKYTGSYKFIEKNNIKLGFLAYNSIHFSKEPENGSYVCKLDKRNMLRDISNLKSQCDIVITSLHWGIENVFYPSPDQISLARNLIDEGASLVLGHHPSVLQGIERYNGGVIVYSLGNFQFIDDAHISIVEKTKETVIGSFEITKKGISGYQIIPCKINKDYVPYILQDEAADKIKHFVDSISRPIINDCVNEKWWFEQIARNHLVGNMDSWILRIKKYGLKHFCQCLRWLISRFTVKCYFGLIRYKLREYR